MAWPIWLPFLCFRTPIWLKGSICGAFNNASSGLGIQQAKTSDMLRDSAVIFFENRLMVYNLFTIMSPNTLKDTQVQISVIREGFFGGFDPPHAFSSSSVCFLCCLWDVDTSACTTCMFRTRDSKMLVFE